MAIKIGADIELGIKKTNFIYIPKSITKYPYIGTDHGGKVLEIRPNPGNTPEQLLNNITILLRKLFVKTKQQKFKIISSPYIRSLDHECSLGGHIHLSWTNELLEYNCRELDNFLVHRMKSPMFLGGMIFAIDALARIIENRNLANARLRCGYGQDNDFRPINSKRIELRRLPSFLYNSSVTRAILAFVYSLLDYEIKLNTSNINKKQKEIFYTKCLRANDNPIQRIKTRLIDIAETVDWFKKSKPDAIALKYLFTIKLPLPCREDIIPNWELTK